MPEKTNPQISILFTPVCCLALTIATFSVQAVNLETKGALAVAPLNLSHVIDYKCDAMHDDSQPAHSIKLVHQPGTNGYQAFCCPDPIEGSDQTMCTRSDVIGKSPEAMLPMNDVTVYPNPASDYIIVKNAHGANLYLFTCMGKQVYFNRVKDEGALDIRSVPCGCYTLKLELENRFRSMTLMVRR